MRLPRKMYKFQICYEIEWVIVIDWIPTLDVCWYMDAMHNAIMSYLLAADKMCNIHFVCD